jgi:hypothetical protein
MYYKASQWVKKHGALPQDTELGVGAVRAGVQLPAESRADEVLDRAESEIKKRLSRSPDRADAFALTFAAPVVPKALREAQNFRQSARKDWNPFDHLRGKQ